MSKSTARIVLFFGFICLPIGMAVLSYSVMTNTWLLIKGSSEIVTFSSGAGYAFIMLPWPILYICIFPRFEKYQVYIGYIVVAFFLIGILIAPRAIEYVFSEKLIDKNYTYCGYKRSGGVRYETQVWLKDPTCDGQIPYNEQSKVKLKKREVFEKLIKSGGWVEVLDMQKQPLFQGWLYTITNDSYGIAVGVLVGKGSNSAFIQDLKKARKIEYIEDGKILAKVIIDFERTIVFSDLTDGNLQSTLKNIIDSNKEIDVMVQLDSEGSSFTENPEDVEAFFKVWQPNSNSPSINTSDKTITSTIQK